MPCISYHPLRLVRCSCGYTVRLPAPSYHAHASWKSYISSRQDTSSGRVFTGPSQMDVSKNILTRSRSRPVIFENHELADTSGHGWLSFTALTLPLLNDFP